jgi:Uma2 family endonuclease
VGSRPSIGRLRSPSDGLEELDAKMREYVENGAALGWLIDPDHRRVWVYQSGSLPVRLDSPPTLAGDPILPGFVLDLAAIW